MWTLIVALAGRPGRHRYEAQSVELAKGRLLDDAGAMQPGGGHPLIAPLTRQNKPRIRTNTERDKRHPPALNRRFENMVRLARESLAFASVASFVWMVCTVANLVG